jgi:hypothetical protein
LTLSFSETISSVKLKNIQDCETREIKPAYLQAVAHQQQAAKPHQKFREQKKKFILETVKMQVPEQLHQQYLDVLLCHHEAISKDKFDLGRTDTLMHIIALKTQEPIYIKQFKINDAHHKEVKKHVLEMAQAWSDSTFPQQVQQPHLCCHEKRC